MDGQSSIDLTQLTSAQFREFIDSFDTVITDCDGVLYHIYKPLPGVPETVNKLRDLNKEIRFLSNNTSLSVNLLEKILNKIGIKAQTQDIISPTIAIIDYLKSRNFQKKVYLISFQNIKDEFEKAGIDLADSMPTEVDEKIEKLSELLTDDEDVGAVVLEADININYLKLIKASIYLKRPEVLFLVGINDCKIPIGGSMILGPGYFYKILEDFTGIKATLFGKPSENLANYVKKIFDIKDPKRILFVGDSLHQDMSFASHCGYQKLLVLTGVNNLEDMQKADAAHTPDYYTDSLADLNTLISKYL